MVAPGPIAIYPTGHDDLAWACHGGCRWDWHHGTVTAEARTAGPVLALEHRSSDPDGAVRREAPTR